MNKFKAEFLKQKEAELKAQGGTLAQFICGKAKPETFQHHIHVKIGDEIHTIACKGNFIDFTDLCKVIDEINSNYQHKVIHNANV